MQRSKIAGIGYYVPKNVFTNEDLKKYMDTSDEWINDALRHIAPLKETDPSLLKNSDSFKGTVKQRLEKLQALLQPKGLGFFFFAKGAYYHDQLAAVVVRDKDIPVLQGLFKKLGMATLSWKECMQVKSRH